MTLTTKERDAIRKYLLGGAPEAGLTELEERILSDDNFYEELLIAEDELIDQYLLGALSEPERSGFVSNFLITDERREKLRFSKNLRKFLNAESEESVPGESRRLVSAGVDAPQRKWFFSFFPISGHPALRISLAAISLVVMLGVSWIVLRNRPSPEIASDKPHSLFVATLSPGLTRDVSETTEIAIPPDKNTVRLQLQLEQASTGYQSYSAELKTSENRTLLSSEKLQIEMQSASRLVNLDVPAEILKVGYYQVRLSGVGESGSSEPVGRYPFRVVK